MNRLWATLYEDSGMLNRKTINTRMTCQFMGCDPRRGFLDTHGIDRKQASQLQYVALRWVQQRG